MKKSRVLMLTFIFSIVIYIYCDSQLFYFGKSIFNIYKALPLSIKPSFRNDFEGGFGLTDEYDFFLVSRGECQYYNSPKTIYVSEFIQYGFNTNSLIAEVLDSNHLKYSIKFNRNPNLNAKQKIDIRIISDWTPIKSDDFKWIELKNSYFSKLELVRNYSTIILFLSTLIMLFKKFRNKYNESINFRQPPTK